jgi:hypothetical protein
MSLTKRIDDWFLGFNTRAVDPNKEKLQAGGKNKRNQGRGRKALKAGTGLANLKAAALKHPEVMVKIPKRISGASKGMKGVRNHIDYISRNGELPLETQDGETLTGKKEYNPLTEEWKKLNIPEESKYREALNVVLSMPAGTNPEAVKNAAREFAKDQFDGHQYVFALHTDQPHPHVHICVLMRDEFGQRMNPRKNDLFEWRVRFAEKMREQGVPCAATKRQHRGVTQKGKPSIPQHISSKGRHSYIYAAQAKEIVEALKTNTRPKHPFLKEAMQTRGFIASEYKLIARELYKLGLKTEAKMVSQLSKDVQEQDFTTRAQQVYDELSPNQQQQTKQEQEQNQQTTKPSNPTQATIPQQNNEPETER